MKKSLSVIAAALALVLAFSCMPVFSVQARTVEPMWTVPEGYNANDYDKCAAFLEQTDENGIKNGAKLSESYDPNDPSTWGTYEATIFWGDDDDYEIVDMPRFDWLDIDGELRIGYICLDDQTYDEDWGVVGVLDLSGCSELIEITCADNFIEALDLTGCTGLYSIICFSNRLTELDLSGCPQLYSILCGSNELTELDISCVPDLTTLSCEYNILTELDVSHNPMLSMLICYGNALTELDVSNLTELDHLDCDDNFLTELDISNNTLLDTLYCSYNELTELDVSHNTALTYFYCYGNALTELDLTNNPNLAYFDCSSNPITELDLSACNELEYLYCAYCRLTELIMPEEPVYFYPHVRTLRAEGDGYVGFCYDSMEGSVALAFTDYESEFFGWFDENDTLVSSDDELILTEGDYNVLTARFNGSVIMPGDVDGSGTVTVSDAILTLRAAMQLITLDDAQIVAADINGDNEITVSDAIMILRTAMGLI